MSTIAFSTWSRSFCDLTPVNQQCSMLSEDLLSLFPLSLHFGLKRTLERGSFLPGRVISKVNSRVAERIDIPELCKVHHATKLQSESLGVRASEVRYAEVGDAAYAQELLADAKSVEQGGMFVRCCTHQRW